MSPRNFYFFLMWFGLVVLLPIHTVKFVFYALRTYIQMLLHVSTEPLHHYYAENIKLYQDKKNAVEQFDTLL